jgi:hydrogenase nickel incorporation protein HypA/HybF
MYERSSISELLTKIESAVEAKHAQRAVVIKVKLGRQAPMSPDRFQERFQEASKGTVAEGARLEIETIDDWTDPLSLEVVLDRLELES